MVVVKQLFHHPRQDPLSLLLQTPLTLLRKRVLHHSINIRQFFNKTPPRATNPNTIHPN